MTFQSTGYPTTPPQSPSVGTPGQSRGLMRPRTAWQGFARHNGQETDLSTPPHSPPHKRNRMSQLPTGLCIPMDTQRLLSVLKVIHNELTALTGRITELEGKITELKSSIDIEFELETESEGGEESSEEESDDDSDESDASVQSAPPSFQY